MIEFYTDLYAISLLRGFSFSVILILWEKTHPLEAYFLLIATYLPIHKVRCEKVSHVQLFWLWNFFISNLSKFAVK